MIKVLFVCMGNVCRSPAAAAILNGMAKKSGLETQITCGSAGLSDSRVGEGPDTLMVQVAKEHGYLVVGQARQFEIEDFAAYDYIIPMDTENYSFLLKLAPNENFRNKIELFSHFNLAFDVEDVPDPYGGTPDQFLETFEIVHDGCAGLLNRLKLVLRS